MSTQPLVSVALVAYEHYDTAFEALSAVCDQTYRNLDIVVLDDGSARPIDDIVARIGDSRVRYISQSNAGPSLATNRAIAATRGEFVALHSADDVSAPSRIERQLDYLRSRQLDVVFSDFIMISEAGEVLPTPHDLTFMMENSRLSEAEILRLMFRGFNVFCAGSALIRRDALDRIGMFDPRLMQLQDYDLWIRMLRGGLRVGVAPEALYRYRKHDRNLSGAQNALRIRLERHLITKRFFRGMPDALFYEAFEPDCFFIGSGRARRRINEVLCYLNHPESEMRDYGYEMLFRFANMEPAREEWSSLGVDALFVRQLVSGRR